MKRAWNSMQYTAFMPQLANRADTARNVRVRRAKRARYSLQFTMLTPQRAKLAETADNVHASAREARPQRLAMFAPQRANIVSAKEG